MMGRKRDRGFTLIELLAVIVVIGILAGMLFSVLQQARKSARKKKCVAEIQEVVKAWKAYYGVYGSLPAYAEMDAAAVDVLRGNNAGANPRNIKFMDFPEEASADGFRDPWGRRYRLEMNVAPLTNQWLFQTKVYFINRKAYEHE